MRNSEFKQQMMSGFVVFNGEVLSPEKVQVSFDNRAFRYGDAFFETIKCNGHYPLLFSLHYKRMVRAMINLKMDISSLPKESILNAYIVKLLQKKKCFGASRVRIQVFRAGEGLYTPQSNKVNYIIESSDWPSVGYELNEKGLFVDVYQEMKKQYSPISFFKNSSSLYYVLAGCFKRENNLDDSLLINDYDKIIEANSSNLFWVKNGVVFTPSVFAGCVDGVMRTVVLETLRYSGVASLIETQGATEQELLDADEMFLTNAMQGVQWVVGFKEKRYFSKLTKKISRLLNQAAFES